MGRMVDTSNTSGSRSDHWESCRRNSNSLVRLKFLASADLQDVDRQVVRTRQLLYGLLRSLRKRRRLEQTAPSGLRTQRAPTNRGTD